MVLPLRSGFESGEWAGLAEAVRGRITTFAHDVLRFNPVRNLVSRIDPEREVARLVEESVRAGGLLGPIAGPWIDIGSGSGFPGIVFGAMWPDVPIVLVERRRGRCDFLRREVRSLGLANAEVFEGDARTLGGPGAGFVVAKAVSHPAGVIALATPLLAAGGRVGIFHRAGWAGLAGEPSLTVELSAPVLEDDSAGDRWFYLVRP